MNGQEASAILQGQEAWRLGILAYSLGQPKDANPFEPDPRDKSNSFQMWRDAWTCASGAENGLITFEKID